MTLLATQADLAQVRHHLTCTEDAVNHTLLILRAIRTRLQHNATFTYLCIAAKWAGEDLGFPYTAAHLTRYFTLHLAQDDDDTESTVGSWLNRELGENYSVLLWTYEYLGRMCREAWVDRMIYQLELDGTLP